MKMKAFMPTVTMPLRDWEKILFAVGAAHAVLAKTRRARDADEMELVGRQIARACRHQAREARKEKSR